MSDLSKVRRLGVVIFALAIGAVFLRRPLAEQLAARGDTSMLVGLTNRAAKYYSRAELFDPSVVQESQLVMLSLESDKRKELLRVLHIIAHLPGSSLHPSLLFDRALIEWRLGEAQRAEVHAQRAGQLHGPIQDWLFAGIIARRRGEQITARRDFEMAAHLAPKDPRPKYELARWDRRTQ